MNISELQKTSAKSYVGDRLYFHNNYGFMIVGFHENWKEIFWLEEEKEHGYFYLVSAPYDDDNQLVCKGYRDLDGTIRNNIGVDLDIEVVREIHNIRKENWIKTTKLMNKIIANNIKNNKAKLPPEVQKVKDQLANFTIKSL